MRSAPALIVYMLLVVAAAGAMTALGAASRPAAPSDVQVARHAARLAHELGAPPCGQSCAGMNGCRVCP